MGKFLSCSKLPGSLMLWARQSSKKMQCMTKDDIWNVQYHLRNVFVRWAEVSTYVCLLWLLYCKSNLLCSKQTRKDAFQEVLRNTLHSISFNHLYTFRRYWESSIAFPLLVKYKMCFEKSTIIGFVWNYLIFNISCSFNVLFTETSKNKMP